MNTAACCGELKVVMLRMIVPIGCLNLLLGQQRLVSESQREHENLDEA